MEITASSVFDYESIKAFFYASVYKKKRPRRYFVFMNIWIAVLELLILVEMLAFGADGMMIVLFIAMAMLIIANCLMYFAAPKIQFASLQKMQGIKNEFTFCEDVIKVSSHGEFCHSETELQYSLIPKVMETSKYLFIYQSKAQAFIVDKSTIANGTIDDVRSKLLPFVKKKYILCKY